MPEMDAFIACAGQPTRYMTPPVRLTVDVCQGRGPMGGLNGLIALSRQRVVAGSQSQLTLTHRGGRQP